jgi:hypothetical protein
MELCLFSPDYLKLGWSTVVVMASAADSIPMMSNFVAVVFVDFSCRHLGLTSVLAVFHYSAIFKVSL